MNIQEIIFVYNADTTLFSVATDFVKKIMTPETYECNLCMITYGSLAMKKEWQEYVEALPYKNVFLHRDEFLKLYPELSEVMLPAVFVRADDGEIRVLAGGQQINDISTIDELKVLINDQLSEYNK